MEAMKAAAKKVIDERNDDCRAVDEIFDLMDALKTRLHNNVSEVHLLETVDTFGVQYKGLVGMRSNYDTQLRSTQDSCNMRIRELQKEHKRTLERMKLEAKFKDQELADANEERDAAKRELEAARIRIAELEQQQQQQQQEEEDKQ